MAPSMNDIIQIIPAPDRLSIVYSRVENEEGREKEISVPAAACALVAVDDGFGCIERDVLVLVATDIGLCFAEDDIGFDRLEWESF